MKYEGQAIYCFDEDLWEHADLLQIKRKLAGEAKKSKTVKVWDTPKETANLPENGRLVLVGHGRKVAGRAMYLFSGRDWEPKQLATYCGFLLGGTRITRISLHMCYGAGDAGAGSPPGTDPRDWYISPERSFAAEFASYAGGLAEWISARTNETFPRSARTETDNQVAQVWRVVGKPGYEYRHQAEGDKVLFRPHPESSLEEPREAGRMFTWKVNGVRKAALIHHHSAIL